MEEHNHGGLTKKYGLITAICMVVGIVIGSGVFFKASKVLANTGANIGRSLLVVGIVGAIMIICSYVFATLANKYSKVNGLVDYAEATLGRKYAYYVSWFMTTIYYPCLTSTLAWISAQYTCILFGMDVNTATHLVLAAVYLIGIYILNSLAPKLAGHFQVSTTYIKLVPLVIMGIVGTIVGIVNGTTLEAFQTSIVAPGVTNDIFAAVCAFAFAYEGWIIATTINAELKDSKRNLSIALIVGAVIVVGVYMLYFLGMTGALSTLDIINAGNNLPIQAFTELFHSPVIGTIIMVFVVISCLGTTNGLMLGCCRGMYAMAARNEGPKPKLFAQIDKETNMPHNSAIIGLLCCAVWLAQWQLLFYNHAIGESTLPAFWCWEADEVTIITLYAFYIPIFISMMIKAKDLNVFKRFIMPGAAVLCCLFMIFCAYSSYQADGQIWSYLIVFALIMLIGFLCSSDFKKIIRKKTPTEETADPAEQSAE